jgi:hypothetical protein
MSACLKSVNNGTAGVDVTRNVDENTAPGDSAIFDATATPDVAGTDVVYSLDDAVARGSAALEMHIRGMKEDGLPIPDPRSIDAIQADNSLDGWRDGAVLIWVPVIIETGESRRVNVSFDAALLEAVDHEAGRRGMTRSGLLADAVRKEIVTT